MVCEGISRTFRFGPVLFFLKPPVLSSVFWDATLGFSLPPSEMYLTIESVGRPDRHKGCSDVYAKKANVLIRLDIVHGCSSFSTGG